VLLIFCDIESVIYYGFCCLLYILLSFNIVEHKVIIVGLDNAGKTTILYQL